MIIVDFQGGIYMPIPFLVGAALAGLATAAGVGVKKTIDAHQDNKEANRVNERANDIIQSATNEANAARKIVMMR